MIDLGSNDEQALLIALDRQRRQIAGMSAILAHPQAPVVARAEDELTRRLLAHHLIDRRHRAVVRGGGHPVVELPGPPCRDLQGDAGGRVDRPLRDRIAAQLAVFGVAPGTLRPANFLRAARVPGNPRFPVDDAIHEEISIVLIVDDRPRLRIVERGIANLRPANPEIVMKKHADLTRAVRVVPNDDTAHQDVLVEIHGVLERQGDAERVVPQRHIGHERLVSIHHSRRPVFPEPTEPLVDPDPNPECMARRVVLLSNVRKVDVADEVLAIERDQQSSVRERKVTRHMWRTPWRLATQRREPPRGAEAGSSGRNRIDRTGTYGGTREAATRRSGRVCGTRRVSPLGRARTGYPDSRPSCTFQPLMSLARILQSRGRLERSRFVTLLEHRMRIATWLAAPLFGVLIALPAQTRAQVAIRN